MSQDVAYLMRVGVIVNVYHDQEGYEKELFFVYIAFLLQLHVWLSFDEVTMGMLRVLNGAPT